ncbi:MAG: hypothetical protein ACRDYF_19320, partial [Acidimicrobiia bacterium]
MAWQNLDMTAANLTVRIGTVRRRLTVPCGCRQGRISGYPTPAERFQAQRRLQVLEVRLARIEARLGEGLVSICRGGRR